MGDERRFMKLAIELYIMMPWIAVAIAVDVSAIRGEAGGVV